MGNESVPTNPGFACHNHPDRQATRGCWRCQKLICDECSETLLGKTYCKTCAEEVEKLSSKPDESNILKREINSPALMIVIIIVALAIAGVEIFVMTR